MMKNKVLLVTIGLVVGFFVGYFIFGKLMGNHISLGALFDFSGGDLGKFGRSVGGVKNIQQKVFLSAAAGAVIAYLYGRFKK